MPKVVSYTPPWLSRPSPGSKIFSDPEQKSPTSPSKRGTLPSSTNGDADLGVYQRPERLLAKRGTEIFVVVGNKIRWADLSAIKDDWEEQDAPWKRKSSLVTAEPLDQAGSPHYRTLTTPVYYQIRQLVVSPSGSFLAILTEHTVHIAILPEYSRLSDHDRSPLKLKTYQLGPTTHVIPESPVVSALWHPLAASNPSSDCLVTVTAEAAVRLWEIDRSNQWSFERPALAIDLKKLVDGTSCEQDFEPSGFGKNRGFSVDTFDMEVSAACFGSQGQDEKDGWASMTLWAAMRNGDVYALCPLLPSKWQPTSTTIPSLTTSVVSGMASIEDANTDEEDKRAASQQYEWVQELDSDEPVMIDNAGEKVRDEAQREVRFRPSNPSAIPRLQGPFELTLEDDLADFEVSDIHVIAANFDRGDLLSGEDDYADFDAESNGFPFGIICLATMEGFVHLSLEMEGVTGQWLPKKGRSTFSVPKSDGRDLVLLESIKLSTETATASPSFWPVFTPDVVSSHTIFVTTRSRLLSISIDDWADKLSAELSSTVEEDAGFGLRMRTACQDNIAVQSEIMRFDGDGTSAPDQRLSAPLVYQDANLGYMLLTSDTIQAHGVLFDASHAVDVGHETFLSPRRSFSRSLSPFPPILDMIEASADGSALVESTSVPPRVPYTPHAAFYNSLSKPLKDMLTTNVPQRQKTALKQPIRLSPATLDIMASAHRILSTQTFHLEKAVAELFRRCERLQEELRDQVKQMSELSIRLQQIGSRDSAGHSSSYEDRISKAQIRQKELVSRYEHLRRKTARAGVASRELSSNELMWLKEINSLDRNIETSQDEASGELERRFSTAKQLAGELVRESEKLGKGGQDGDTTSQPAGSRQRTSANVLSTPKLQKSRIAEAMAMVEREGAVIEAVMARLERLGVGV